MGTLGDMVSVDLEIDFIHVGNQSINQSINYAYVMKPQYSSGHRGSAELPGVVTLSDYCHTAILGPPEDNGNVTFGTLLDSALCSSSFG